MGQVARKNAPCKWANVNKAVECSLKNRGSVLVTQSKLALSYVIEQLNEHFENLIANLFPEIMTIIIFFSFLSGIKND